jgi:hypothetical protein
MSRARIPWTECLRNPQALQSVYGAGALPDLSHVQLQEIAMGESRDMRIGFSVTLLPKVFPARWPASSNRVHMTLAVLGTSALTLDGWHADGPGRLEVIPDADHRRLCFEGDGCRFSVLFTELHLDRVNGYETDVP